ncbi:MAG TPA: phosphate ABC transporter permease subunit PstC [Solirubrobacteraceae bacterium]|jgi:phosphate transport system permease protein|nr:phosphate ABC transporter permease subunit PstC [Solirubrobacteraceae bacterium]
MRANRALKWLALGGGLLVFITLIAIAYEIISGTSTAFDKFGFGFLGHTTWIPSENEFGGWTFIYGTLVTGLSSVVLSTVLGVSIGLFLALMAPRRVAMVIGPLVEMLAAIPSIVIGLIGIVLICPFIASDIEPWVHSVFGWIPIFGATQETGNSIFAAILVLTIMVVPIIAALTRDLFLTVPQDLRDGAEALGSTRWEMIRGVVLPTTRSGITAACMLGFGRAIGEAIAVSQVIGGVPAWPLNFFSGGYTSGGVIANEYPGALSTLEKSSLFYLAAILLLLGVATNLFAQRISRGFGVKAR